MTNSDPFRLPADAATEAQPEVATGKRRQVPASTRRIVLVILGVFVLAASVIGFYLFSDAFDERTPVLVAAVDIKEGDVVGADMFTSDLAVMGSIPHIPYTPDAQLAFDGFTASQAIPAGTVILGDMFIPPTLPGPGDLELTVLFDTSLLTSPAYNGDTVLVVAPGIEPAEEDPGRPHEAIDTLVLSNYQEDGTMTMFFAPEELEQWSAWRLLPEAIGAAPQIMLVPLGADPEEFPRLINAAWQSEWETRAAAAALLAEETQTALAEEVTEDSDSGALESPRDTAAARGELELTVQFDTSLLTSSAYNGDTVLVVDPGIEPAAGETAPVPSFDSTASGPGRPPKAITHLELSNYEDGSMTMFFRPREELEDWSAWRLLPEAIGATPQIMLVPSGIEPERFAHRINAAWHLEWEAKVAIEFGLTPPQPDPGTGDMEVTIPIDTSLATTELVEGDTVLLIDPGQLPDDASPGRPRRVLQEIELEKFDGNTIRRLVPPHEWLEWLRLPEDLGASPMVLPIPEGTGADDETTRLNEEWRNEWLAAIGELPASEGGE